MDLEEMKRQLAAAQDHGFAKIGVEIELLQDALDECENEVEDARRELESAEDNRDSAQCALDEALALSRSIANFREWAVDHLGEDGYTIGEHESTEDIINKLAAAVEQEEEFRRRQTTLEF